MSETTSGNVSSSNRLGRDQAAELKEVYERLREQVTTENDLYNQRIIWLVSMNAFLFATVGLILQAKFGGGSAPIQGASTLTVQDVLDLFLIIFSVVGFLVSLISRRLLMGANRARREVEGIWETYVAKLGLVEDLAAYPHVAGGKDAADKYSQIVDEQDEKKKLRKTWFSSGNLPVLFANTWCVFFVLIIALLVCRHMA